MLKVGIIIICRYSSRRLPGKILMKVRGKTILENIVDRLTMVVKPGQLLIATSEEISDEPIVREAKSLGISLYRGSLHDVAGRFLSAAEEGGFDYAFRINGDNLFVDLDAFKEMIDLAKSDKYDFISNVKGRTFPKGMSIECVRVSFYQLIYKKLESEFHKEHVTIYLYEKEDELKEDFEIEFVINDRCPAAAGVDLAVDTREDFQQAIFIASNLSGWPEYDLEEIIKVYEQYKSIRG